MFNLDITGAFSGAHPATAMVLPNTFRSAVAFYKSKLRARETASSSGNYVRLESAYGFRLKVEKAPSAAAAGNSVRLALAASVDKMRVARALGGGAAVRRARSGLVVTDPFGVRWTIV